MKSFSEERKFMPERIEISLSLSDKYLFIKRRHGGYYIFSKKKDKKGNDGSSLIREANDLRY